MKKHCSIKIEVKVNLKASDLRSVMNNVPGDAKVTVIRGYNGNQFDSSPDVIKFDWDEEL